MMYRKISKETISEIKKFSAVETGRELSRRYGVSQTTVHRIINGKYDKGKIDDRNEVVPDGCFDVDLKEKTWLI